MSKTKSNKNQEKTKKIKVNGVSKNENLEKIKKVKVKKNFVSLNNVSQTSSKPEGKRKNKVSKEHKVVKKMKKTSV